MPILRWGWINISPRIYSAKSTPDVLNSSVQEISSISSIRNSLPSMGVKGGERRNLDPNVNNIDSVNRFNDIVGESFSITNFEGHGLVIVPKGHLFTVNIDQGTYPVLKEGKEERSNFHENILGDAGGSRNRSVVKFKYHLGFGQSWET
ncbi:hypothetical protein Tco_0198848 [Tanacetum coccineum]